MNERKVLMLSAGEASKTTILKQIRHIFTKTGVDEQDRKPFRDIVWCNLSIGMKYLLLEHRTLFPLEPISKENREIAEKLLDTPDVNVTNVQAIFPLISSWIKKLWKEEAVLKKVVLCLEKFQFNDAFLLFADRDEVYELDYLPSYQDTLLARVKTTGIVELEFLYQQLNFRVIDVGGQRSERKKWIHFFQDVTGIILPIPLSEYCLTCYEDDVTNRLHEQLKLFKEIVNSKFFPHTIPMYLVFTKYDIFIQNLSVWNLDYYIKLIENGGYLVDSIQEKFVDIKTISTKEVNTFIANRKEKSNRLWFKRYYPESKKILLKEEIEKRNEKEALQAMLELAKNKTESNSKPTKKSTSIVSNLFSWMRKKKNNDKIESSQPIIQSPSPSIIQPLNMHHENVKSEKISSKKSIEILLTVLEILPSDCILYICEYLSPIDICNLQSSCKHLYLVAAQNELWESICLRQNCPTISTNQMEELALQYKEQYLQPNHIQTEQDWIYQRMFKYAYTVGYFLNHNVEAIIQCYLKQIEDVRREHQILQQIYVCNALDTHNMESILRQIFDHQISFPNDVK